MNINYTNRDALRISLFALLAMTIKLFNSIQLIIQHNIFNVIINNY